MTEKAKKTCRAITGKPRCTTPALLNHRQHRFHPCACTLLFMLLASVPAVAAPTHPYSAPAGLLSQQILNKARQLSDLTHRPAFNRLHAETILAQLKHLIKDYEQTVVLHQSPYPGEVLLGTTPPGDGAWLETTCYLKHRRPIKQIKLTRTGTKAKCLRINDIELTYMTPKGPARRIFNKNGRVKLYYGRAYTLSLPKPMRVVRVRVLTHHKSTGLNVYGVY